MIYTSTVTQKGQATIPAPIRAKLGIKPGQKVIFEEQKQQIIIKNQHKLVDELYGSLKPRIKVKYSDKKANAAIGKFLAEQHQHKYGKID